MPTIDVTPDYETLSERAVGWLVERLQGHPAALLCLASGSSPVGTYQRLAKALERMPLVRDRVRVLKLDEWGGLPLDDPATCEHHLQSVLVRPLGLGDRYQGFVSQPAHPEQECARIRQWLDDQGPLDICVLGLGLNGHLGFNEPAEELQPRPHCTPLSATSKNHPMVRGRETRDLYGITLGMADILQAREILLLVHGKAKLEPLTRLLAGPIATQFPASLLLTHPRCHIVCDQDAYPLSS